MRTLGLVVSLVTAGTGCNAIFGLEPPPDELAGDADASDDVADEGFSAIPTVTVRYRTRWGEAGPSMSTVTTYGDPLPAFAIDGAWVEGVAVDLATLSPTQFEIPRATTNQRYRVRLGGDEGAPVEYQDDAAHLDIAKEVGFDPMAPRASAGTSIRIPVTTGTRPGIAATGVFDAVVPVANGTGWQVASWAGRPLLGPSDGLFHVRRELVGQAGSMWQHVSAAAATAITMVDGASYDLVEPLAPVRRNICVALSQQVTLQQNLLKMALPRFAQSAGSQWSVVATPDPTLGPIRFHLLASSTDPTTPAGTTTVELGNPFPSTTVVAAATASVTRQIPVPEGGSLTVAANASQYHAFVDGALAGGCVETALPLTRWVPQPDIMVGSTHVSSDFTFVPAPDAPTVPITWSTTGTGVPDSYQVILYRVVDASVSPATRARLSAFFTDRAQIDVDAALFAEGGNYLLEITGTRGQPEIASGNYALYGSDYETVMITSNVFTLSIPN